MRIIPSSVDLAAVWRLLLVRGGIVLVLSVAALPWPVMSLVALVVLVSTIALVAALFDAAIAGALQVRATGGWILLPEALIGVLLGGAVLLYPLVSLLVIGVLACLWMVSRGIMLATIARGAASDAMLRMFALGWAGASVIASTFLFVHLRDASLLPLVYVLVAYALVWSALELAIGLHLRARGRAIGRA